MPRPPLLRTPLLGYAITCLIIVVIAGIVGFGAMTDRTSTAVKVLFLIALGFFVAFLLCGKKTETAPEAAPKPTDKVE